MLRYPLSFTLGLISFSMATSVSPLLDEPLPFLRDLTPFLSEASTDVDAALVSLCEWEWSCECECSWPSPPVAIRKVLSNATNVMKPTRIAAPRSKFLLGSTRTNLACVGSSSPTYISLNRWKMVSPSRPPTAKATIIDRRAGLGLGGHRASRKLGGPEMYNVARREFTAGLPGKIIANMRSMADSPCAWAFLWALSS